MAYAQHCIYTIVSWHIWLAVCLMTRFDVDSSSPRRVRPSDSPRSYTYTASVPLIHMGMRQTGVRRVQKCGMYGYCNQGVHSSLRSSRSSNRESQSEETRRLDREACSKLGFVSVYCIRASFVGVVYSITTIGVFGCSMR